MNEEVQKWAESLGISAESQQIFVTNGFLTMKSVMLLTEEILDSEEFRGLKIAEKLVLKQYANRDTELCNIAKRYGVMNETLVELANKGYANVESLKHLEVAEINQLSIPKPQREVLCTFVHELKNNESKCDEYMTKWAKDVGLNDETLLKLATMGFTSLKTMQHLSNDIINSLSISPAQTVTLLAVMAGPQKQSECDGHMIKWAKDVGLNEETLLKLATMGFTSLKTMQHLSNDIINSLSISPAQTVTLRAVMAGPQKPSGERKMFRLKIKCDDRIEAADIKNQQGIMSNLDDLDRKLFQAVSVMIASKEIPDWVLKDAELTMKGCFVELVFISSRGTNKYSATVDNKSGEITTMCKYQGWKRWWFGGGKRHDEAIEEISKMAITQEAENK